MLDGMIGDESFIQRQQDMMNMFKREDNDAVMASNSQQEEEKDGSKVTKPSDEDVQMNREDSNNLESQIDKIQKQTLQIFEQLKNEYLKDKIYVHECSMCRNKMMLHQSNCPYLECNTFNAF